MESIDDIIELDDTIASIIERHLSRAITSNFSYKCPKTFLSVFTLCGRIDFIKNGIFRLAETNDIYSIKILFRSMIEHSIKQNYIFMRWCEEKTDDPGKEYIQYCNLVEAECIAASYKKQYQFAGYDFKKVNSFQLAKELYPELTGNTDTEIQQKAKQFSYRNILKYISEKLYKNKMEIGIPEILNILPQYSELSSFVHGGPMASSIMFEPENAQILDQEVLYYAELCLSMYCCAIMVTLLMLFQEDKSFGEPHRELSNLLKTTLWNSNKNQSESPLENQPR